MTSLRARAVTGGILWAVVVIVLGLASVSTLVTTQPTARFIEILQSRQTQALIAVANNSDMPQGITPALADPVFLTPLSGHYWQIERSDGTVLRSPSMGENTLPAAGPVNTRIITEEITGPDNEPVLRIAQWLEANDGSQWYVQVASSIRPLDRAQEEIRRNLLNAFAVIAFVGILGALAQVAVVLRPLNNLREEVAARWEDEDGLQVTSYPVEVAPLVADINSLLQRNRDIMQRSRRQAADLAHAIKTPSAIMRNELDTLRSADVDVTEAVAALDRLDAQLKRSFARIRADASAGDVGSFTELDNALGRMTRAFTALARNAGKDFDASFPQGLRIRMDQSDFEEVTGNLLDNALKWANSAVRLRATVTDASRVIITIEDDGPGIPQEARADVMRSGKRLDMTKPGTGLGLAIAGDLVHAYSGELVLRTSDDLGGLSVRMALPRAATRKPKTKA